MTTRREVEQFRRVIIRPTLIALETNSPAAENLLVGTAVHESGLEFLHQNGGPAVGYYQMEPATLHDIYDNFLEFRPVLHRKVDGLLAPLPGMEEQLASNLAFATAVARLKYLRAPEPLPAADDVDGLARYWKLVYNTEKGAGDPAVWAAKYRNLCV